MVSLSYQPSFNPSTRSYSVYGLTNRQNWSYFITYHLDRLLPTKPKKTSDLDFHQARIAQLYGLLRLFLLTYVETLRRIFIRSSLPFYLHLSALSNILLPFITFLNIKQRNIISSLCIYFIIMQTSFISVKYVVPKVPKLCSLHWLCHEISPHLICWKIFYLYIFFKNLICNKKSNKFSAPTLSYLH